MKIKLIATLVLMLSLKLVQGQSTWPLVIQEYNAYSQLWEDTISANQIRHWENGKVRIDYQTLHDSVKIRREYFENGMLKLEAMVYQKFSKEVMEGEDEYGDITYSEWIGFKDYLHGTYKEYLGTHGNKVFTIGQFTHGVPTGEWQKIDFRRSLTLINFSKDGLPKGNYMEYYSSKENLKETLKWEGQFEVRKSRVKYQYLVRNNAKRNRNISGQRNGIWKHYNEEGLLIETVTYDWHLEENK